MPEVEACPTCGAPVRVVSGPEGTSRFVPAPPPAHLTEAARERAEQAADENGVSIDRICIAASPSGEMHAFVLDEGVDEDEDVDD